MNFIPSNFFCINWILKNNSVPIKITGFKTILFTIHLSEFLRWSIICLTIWTSNTHFDCFTSFSDIVSTGLLQVFVIAPWNLIRILNQILYSIYMTQWIKVLCLKPIWFLGNFGSKSLVW